NHRQQPLPGPEGQRLADGQTPAPQVVLQPAGVLLIVIGIDQEEIHRGPPLNVCSSRRHAKRSRGPGPIGPSRAKSRRLLSGEITDGDGYDGWDVIPVLLEAGPGRPSSVARPAERPHAPDAEGPSMGGIDNRPLGSRFPCLLD